MTIWHILISKSVSVYGRYVVGLLSVWVRDCRSAVSYNSSNVLMIGFQSVWCRLCIRLKSGDSIPNLTRDDPDMKPTAFTVPQQHCRWPTAGRFIANFAGFVGFVSVWPVWLGYHEGSYPGGQPTMVKYNCICPKCYYIWANVITYAKLRPTKPEG